MPSRRGWCTRSPACMTSPRSPPRDWSAAETNAFYGTSIPGDRVTQTRGAGAVAMAVGTARRSPDAAAHVLGASRTARPLAADYDLLITADNFAAVSRSARHSIRALPRRPAAGAGADEADRQRVFRAVRSAAGRASGPTRRATSRSRIRDGPPAVSSVSAKCRSRSCCIRRCSIPAKGCRGPSVTTRSSASAAFTARSAIETGDGRSSAGRAPRRCATRV